MAKHYLVIDQGNTRSKAGYFIDNKLIACFFEQEKLNDFLKVNRVDFSIISSVGDPCLLKALQVSFPEALIASTSLLLPIKNSYHSPATLGMDRLANAVAAHYFYPDTHCLVIDVGTCLKCDFVSQSGEYLGGSIGPGLNMRLQALHDYTAKLPLVASREKIDLIGQDTISCIQSGVVNGMENEIFGFIQRYREEQGEIRILFTGGDAKKFDLARKINIFAHENLTLIGLKLMLEANV
jgi:type III pantothenate kinase